MVRPAKKRSLTSSALRGSFGSSCRQGLVQGEQVVAVGFRQGWLDVVEVEPSASAPGLAGLFVPGVDRRGCGAWPRPRRRRSGRGRSSAGRSRRPPAGGTPRGPGRSPGASGPASPGPSAGRRVAATRRRRAEASRPRPSGRRPRPRPRGVSRRTCAENNRKSGGEQGPCGRAYTPNFQEKRGKGPSVDRQAPDSLRRVTSSARSAPSPFR